jgi:hypothetical protein
MARWLMARALLNFLAQEVLSMGGDTPPDESIDCDLIAALISGAGQLLRPDSST